MAMSETAYVLLLLGVGVLRLVEIRISRRNQRLLGSQGVAKAPEPHFRWMILFHIGILVSAGLEVLLFHRPLIPALALIMALLFVLAIALRWWVMQVLGEHWNIQVMASSELGVVVDGPYRWIRHPNYVAVFVELIALPLIYSAWLTAFVGAFIHGWVLSRRLSVEETVLRSNPKYVAVMGSKPRFLPRLFERAAKPPGREQVASEDRVNLRKMEH
jgi:methyltransferase